MNDRENIFPETRSYCLECVRSVKTICRT